MDLQEKIRNWFVPLSAGHMTLGEAYSQLSSFGLKQDEVPFIIQLVENPKYDLPGIDIFHGATDLETHDCIHILLGRGLLIKDEAFVLGFTMGSTGRVTTTEERLFSFFTKHLYPRNYRFTDEDLRVFKDAVRLGFICDSQPLHKVVYRHYFDRKLAEIRRELGVDENLLHAYYSIEKARFPGRLECERLLN